MEDLISRQAAIDAIAHATFDVTIGGRRGFIDYKKEFEKAFVAIRDKYIEALTDLPPAGPERRNGRWQITDAYPHNVYCPECHVKFAQTHWAVWEDGSLPRNFCPNCGADMRGDENG